MMVVKSNGYKMKLKWKIMMAFLNFRLQIHQNRVAFLYSNAIFYFLDLMVTRWFLHYFWLPAPEKNSLKEETCDSTRDEGEVKRFTIWDDQLISGVFITLGFHVLLNCAIPLQEKQPNTSHLEKLYFYLLGPDEEEQKDEKQKKRGSGFTAPLPLSDALVKFIGTGESALSRADVVKRMWDYIKQNDLQVCGGY